ncbi:hypothetical protein ABL840_04885 [Variovorax sp. NFACC27]|uniref:hypothetical protein n=1 Tax=unclassified Variovorax TaxID=663243 RepID=UPI00089694EA|nr:hypothetical protein SAMN03159371_00112 [Variovorax sp. NFACC28]SEF72732.1 hypothetical protein SAMN03159365_00705 [Variovorax sp. NFACC29]SFB77377.1 hypothetical protein SAMN03159379_00704 [Variovorax sp. NFACC26]SFG76974.1 hypothetical protein SAMN03159447_04827 [Variovorax sp. NFACC27]
MSTTTSNRPTLRLVSRPAVKIDADMVAFTVMEHIDVAFPAVWQAVPVGARANIRNAIVHAVEAEAARTGVST